MELASVEGNLEAAASVVGVEQLPWLGTVSATIGFSAEYALFAPNNPSGWAVGTASALNSSGTPTWSLTDSDSGNFQIDSATGVISKAVATVLTTATHSVTIHAVGLTPSPPDRIISIEVASSMDFRQPGNSQIP